MSTRGTFSLVIGTLLFSMLSVPAIAQNQNQGNVNCTGLPSAATLKAQLIAAPGAPPPNDVGGIFGGSRMWAVVVNRSGQICATAASQSDPTQVWPGSQAIAKAKAYTANAFSLDVFALSTARLYTITQPGHSLFSLGQSNTYNPNFLLAPGAAGADTGAIEGGLIFFGGGVPLYTNSGTKLVGGLGVSGDTSCADHEIAKRVRDLLGLNPAGGATADDITYTVPDGASIFTHPLCFHTWRNGGFVGEEAPASGY